MANDLIGPAGFGQSSLIPGQAGLRAEGVDTTIANIREWGDIVTFIVGLTSKKTAESIMVFSNKILPFDTGELMDSGFIDSIEGAGNKLFSEGGNARSTILETGGAEGSIDAFDLAPDITPTFMARGGLGRMRTYTKYTCGYTADYAAKVHENLHNAEWRPTSKSGRTNPFGDGPKKDHFLLLAYHAHQDKFSQAMKIGIEQANARIAARAAANAPKPTTQTQAGLAVPGRPRLVRPR